MRRLHSRPLLALLIAVCSAGFFGSPAATARSKPGTLAVRVKKLGKGPKATTVRTVRIVDASTGEVVLADGFGASGKATVRPPAGVYFAIANVTRPKSVRTGVSKVFRFDPAKRKSVSVPLRLVPGDVTPVRAARPRAVPGAPVATMGHVTLSAGGYAASIGSALFTPLFNATTGFLTWVDTSTGFIIARGEELALQADGQTDPSTHINDNPLSPDIQVEGELLIDADGNVTGEITLHDPVTGEVIDRIRIDTTLDDWQDMVRRIAERIAELLRRRATTTTTTSTTTTSTTTSSSTTSTTPPSTTPTTTSPLPTTTTLPSGTCKSVIPASFCECALDFFPCSKSTDCQPSQGACVDHVGHTKITYQFAGQGGRAGAVQISTPDEAHPDEGLFDVNNGAGVGVLGGCGTFAFSQGRPALMDVGKTSCSAYYHAGTEITVRAGRHINPIPHSPPWCLADFAGFSGPVGCAGMGTCDDTVCTCTFTAGSGDQQLTISYTAQENASCTAPAAP